MDASSIFGSPFFIGALGAVVGLRVAAADITWRARVVNVVCGLLIAGFSAPGLVEWLHLPGLIKFYSFLIGMLGLNFLVAVHKGMATVDYGAVITGWISKRGKQHADE
jgi:hypothetical protein